jgi:putative endopeptidase
MQQNTTAHASTSRTGLTVITLAALVTISATVFAGQSQYGAFGLDTAGADFSTPPGRDFFRYANGAWIDKTPVPADKPGMSLRLAMTDTIDTRLRTLLEQAASDSNTQPQSVEAKVGAFYRSFMDEAAIEVGGAHALDGELAAVKAAKNRKAIAALMGRSIEGLPGSVFGLGIDADIGDPDRYAVYVGQAGLGLPDRDFYLEPGFAATKAAYQAYVSRLLSLLHWPDAEANAKKVVAFETAIAKASWTKVQERDVAAMYNPMTVEQLTAFAPGFDWSAFFAAARLGSVKRVVLNEKSAFPNFAALIARTPPATLQAWQAFHIADRAAPYLSKPFVDAHFELHDKTLTAQKEQRPRWKRANSAVAGGDCGAVPDSCFGTLNWAVGELYSARYFPPEAKAKIESLVANVKAAYRVRLEKLDWMSEATRAEALRKLDTYIIKVGYPDHPRNYDKLEIRADDLVGNVRRAAEADWAFQVSRLNGPVDKTAWLMTPQTNDAYNGSLRDIAFPAGILQPPMFDPDADPAINYGAIGGVIGHELTHGFDDEGRKLDSRGALRDWWTADDAGKFEARAKRLGAQYSAFEPVPGSHVNGDLTMGENIADLGGLILALDAYHASLNGEPAPVLDGLTGDQRVFLGWAQAWRGKFNDQFVKQQVVSDPHSPRQYRVNGVVRNIDAWYGAFDVKPGDALYIAPDDRVRIW